MFVKSKDKSPSTKDFHVHLGKPENKIGLQVFLLTAFHRTAATLSTEIKCVGSTLAKDLTTHQLMHEFTCFHAEAASAMFTIYSMLQSEVYTAAVILDTTDTDNYVQAAHVSEMTRGLLCEMQMSPDQCLVFVR